MKSRDANRRDEIKITVCCMNHVKALRILKGVHETVNTKRLHVRVVRSTAVENNNPHETWKPRSFFNVRTVSLKCLAKTFK